ncbi:MAG: DNA-3-methyladenine glycosylase 2 family protein [Planctomycetota bacterium]|nr:DNA-3-methyladenine glycosylase 2 family protein [Planctomycetota bacterium]
MALTRAERTHAVVHLRGQDRVLRKVIDQVGPFTLKVERKRFTMLVRAIISQQISTGAARSIRRRLEELVAPHELTEASIGHLSKDELRSAGVSPQKAGYLLDLAEKVSGDCVNLNRIGRLSNESVIRELTQVKGIGRWTAQMFLIFSLGRLDVFPHDDLGVRSAIRELYGFAELPGKEECLEIAAPWSPYESVASWYCWRLIDLTRQKRVASVS